MAQTTKRTLGLKAWAIRLAIKETQHDTLASVIFKKAEKIQENRKQVKAGTIIASVMMDKRAVRTIDLDKVTLKQFMHALEKEGTQALRWQLLRRCV